jgi:nicotinic acid mononucleotide adenylyltransferase
MKKTIYLLIASLAIVSCGQKKSESQAETVTEQPATRITVMQAQSQTVPQTEVYSSTVQAFAVNNIAPQSGNRIKKINVDIGSFVKKGQVLAEMDDVELNIPPPNYTIKTLDALKEREPENDFTLIIGADNLAGLSRWRQVRKILSGYEVMVYPRRGFDSPKLLEELLQWCSEKHVHCKGVHLIDAPLVDISSSEIRNAEAKGLDVSEWLM